MIRLRANPLTESATLLRRLVVILGSLGLTALYSLLVIGRASVHRLDRDMVDAYVRGWSATLLQMVRVSLIVKGEVPEFGNGRRYIILSTHASLYDIPATFVSMPGSVRMLAKRELFRVPLLGAAMKAAEFPSIDRHSRSQAVQDLARARSMMESGIVLWAAPEGTRSSDARLLPFKKGCFYLAMDTEAIIIPVAIRGIHHVLQARSWKINLGQPVEVRVGAPIDTSGMPREQVAVLMAQVRSEMEELLGDGEAR